MKLASVFTDHAVFQRGIPVPIWGPTTPDTLVTATLNKQDIPYFNGEQVGATGSGFDDPQGCNLYNREGFPASPFRTDTW